MKFRSDIQILRGLSVLFVVLYHLDLSVLHSGFLGVDIFFVISGFLMAILYDDNNKLSFFIRRARRLLPAYFVVIIITLITSFAVTTPNETAQVTLQAKFAAFFSSNIGFWLQNSYFNKAEFNPLLHLWSLGVEIQFYLIIPVLYWIFSKSKLLLPLTAILSVYLCFTILEISPKTSFFMMPLRLWEFLIGYGVALHFTNNGIVKNTNYSFAGLISLLVLVLIPFMAVNGESQNIISGHPGLHALLIVLATSGVLIFGLPSTLLKTKMSNIFTILGNYSYSIYLAHFPIIVLYLSVPFSGTILQPKNSGDTFLIILLTTVFSYLLYNLVEKQSKRLPIKLIVVAPILLILLLTSILPSLELKNTPVKEQHIFNAFTDRSVYRCGKIFRILNPKEISCELTNTPEKPQKRFMLIGNSHADSIKTTFTNVANEEKVSLFFMVSNEPLMEGGVALETVEEEIINKDIDTIILHYSPSALSIKMIEDITTFSEKNNINVAYIYPVPIWEKHIPQIMYNNIINGDLLPIQSRKMYLSQNKKLFNGINQIRNKNFKTYQVIDYLCKEKCKFSTIDGIPFYFDTEHLTLTGSKELIELFRKVVKN